MEHDDDGLGAVLEVLSAGAAQGLVAALDTRITEALGAPVHASFGPVGEVDGWLRAGRGCDVVVTSEPRLAALDADGLVASGSARPIGPVATGLAVHIGCATRGIDDVATFVDLVRGASRIHCSDPRKATAGAHFLRVLERLGVQGEVRDRLAIHPNGAAAMRALAGDDMAGAIGCAQATEIAAEPGVQPVGALPGDLALTTMYVGFVRSGTEHADSAARFLDILCGDDARELRRTLGFG